MNRIRIFDNERGNVIFSYECEDNTVAGTLERAVAYGVSLRHASLRSVDLRDANLRDANLRGADLRGADLRGASLHSVDLCDANLRYASLRSVDLRDANSRDANLRGADLRGADLRGANLYGADLRDANLRDADLRGANLRDANLRGADLRGANLYGVGLRDANLRDADLRDANLHMVRGLYCACPTEGEFIGWKKASGFIVKLRIPADALRSSAASTKCRCNKAFVLDIQNCDGGETDVYSVASDRDSTFKYVRNSWVAVDDFDTNSWNECAPGIHFFVDREEAVDY